MDTNDMSLVRNRLKEALKPFGSYAERMALDPPRPGMETVPAKALLEPDVLRKSIGLAAEQWNVTELVVAASLWNKQYNAAVLTGPLAAMTLCGIGLDASIENASIVLSHGVPSALHLNDWAGLVACKERLGSEDNVLLDSGVPTISKGEELHRYVLPRAFAGHLEPAIEQMKRVTGLSKNVTWDNVGNLCAYLYELFADEGNGPVVEEDRGALLAANSVAVEGRNPMYGSVWYEEPGIAEGPERIRVRKSCCLQIRLTDRPACYVCPLLPLSTRVGIIIGRETETNGTTE